MPPVGGIGELAQTSVAQKSIRWYLGEPETCALMDRKVSVRLICFLNTYRINTHFFWKVRENVLESFGIIYNNHYACADILHVAVDPGLGAGLVDEGAESNPLYNSGDGETEK